jgi:hypothetical protein
MKYSIIEIQEAERKAIFEGDTIKAQFLGDLLDARVALKELAEKGECLIDSLKNQANEAPEWLEKGAFIYWAHDVDLENFREMFSDPTVADALND